MHRSAILSSIASLSILAAATSAASASTVFFDGTFNPANYAPTPAYSSVPGATISYSQCASCGNPGSALQFQLVDPNVGTSGIFTDLGAVNLTFAYNPMTEGAITSIAASVDKNIFTTTPGTGLTDTFRPLIEQGGVYYLAAIHGPTYTGPTPHGTGYPTLSGTLTAADFTSFDFATGTFGSAHPNFAGSTLLLGIGQIATFPPGTTTNIDYDNLKISVSSVPLPPALPMFGAALAMLGAVSYGLKRRRSAPAV